jgi:DNA-binding response OmpR family regulator
MGQIMVIGEVIPDELKTALNTSGFSWKSFDNLAQALQTNDLWDLVIISAVSSQGSALNDLKDAKAKYELEPVLAIFSRSTLNKISIIESVELELGQRIGRIIKKFRAEKGLDLITFQELVIDPNTYQVSVKGRILDLTYMEYQLLAFLVSHPGKVYSRESLLSRVWGYEYFGGGRTVDVHIRRLRSKLGEEYAQYIQTVRSVGYKFGRY